MPMQKATIGSGMASVTKQPTTKATVATATLTWKPASTTLAAWAGGSEARSTLPVLIS